MNRSLFRKEVAPFLILFGLLILLAILFDALLHQFDLIWIGRWLGIPGTLLILFSFAHSMRKRKIIQIGTPRGLLELHEKMTWAGALMILIHAGVHIYAPLPWFALLAMLVTVISGMTGKYLLRRSRQFLEEKRDHYRQQQLSAEEVEQHLFHDAIAFDLMKQWRVVHIPITVAFATLGLTHILTTLLFWEWR
jgi:hypothetical protein